MTRLVPTKTLLLLIAGAMAMVIAACSEDPEPTNTPTSPPPTNTPVSASEPLSVVASIYPMQYFAERIGGDRVEVETIVRPGVEAHAFELTASDLLTIAEADVVVTNGLSLLPWLDRALESLGDDVSGIVVEAAYAEAALPFVEDGHHDEHGHEDEHGHMEEGEDEHGHGEESSFDGRLLIADLEAQHLSVLDLSTEELDTGAFDIGAPPAAIYPSPTHRYAFVLARGPGEADDGIHIFDGGVYLVEHGDHFDLVREPVSRHPSVVTDERPIHFVNSYGWTAVFADAHGHAYLYNEEEITGTQGDYQPIVFETGDTQHGAALAISPDRFIVTTVNPDYPENTDSTLPVGVEVRNLAGDVVYDASNGSCPGMHGETHNEEGAIFGCVGGVLFLHPEGGSYHHEFIDNPPEMREESRIGSFFGHHHLHHFFGRASYFDGQGFADDGIWLIDPEAGEFRQVFSEPVAAGAVGGHAERLYLLTTEGELHVLDAHDGDEIAHVHLMEPGEGRPRLIIVGETMFLTNPDHGEIISVDLDHLEVEEVWDVGGSPTGIAFVGILGEGEDHEEHGHEDEDEHGHEDEDEHGHEDEDEHGHMEGDDHGHGEFDPHFWLDPLRAVTQAERIAEALIEADPEGADVYRANLATLSSDLRALHSEFEAGLSSCVHREFVTSHSAYGYLAEAYGLEQVGIAGLSPEAEPSPQRLASIADRIKDLGITAVLLEPVLSGENERALASETGAGIYQIHAIESVTQAELDEHRDYFGLMRDNLKSLRAAMECS